MLSAVIDASTLVGAALKPGSVPHAVLGRVVTAGTLWLSAAILAEVTDVLARPKFDRYLVGTRREDFLRLLGDAGRLHEPAEHIRACRDPKDDMYLSLAVSAGADCIVSSDDDLLCLSPFRGIPILTPRAFLDQYLTDQDMAPGPA